MLISQEKLDLWVRTNKNVLFVAEAGVGKTAITKETFTRHFGERWRYFSAATMDPWVDFIGVPRAVKREDSDEMYLDMVRPKDFADDQIEAIFLDEFNRAPKKVRNATMELIQFKSINGRRFPNLKIVWAAINPYNEDENDYDVDKLDPAQLDRFEVHYEVPYKCDATYFKNKYGVNGITAVQWWDQWVKKSPKEARVISPRRLDYAVQYFLEGGDLVDILAKSTNPAALQDLLTNGTDEQRIERFVDNNNTIEAEQWLANQNNFGNVIEMIMKNSKFVDFYEPMLNREYLKAICVKSVKIKNLVSKSFLENGKFTDCIKEIDPSVFAKQAQGGTVVTTPDKNASLAQISGIFANMKK